MENSMKTEIQIPSFMKYVKNEVHWKKFKSSLRLRTPGKDRSRDVTLSVAYLNLDKKHNNFNKSARSLNVIGI